MTQFNNFLRQDNETPTRLPSVATVSRLQPCDGGVGITFSEVTEMDGNGLVRAGICGFESRLRGFATVAGLRVDRLGQSVTAGETAQLRPAQRNLGFGGRVTPPGRTNLIAPEAESGSLSRIDHDKPLWNATSKIRGLKAAGAANF